MIWFVLAGLVFFLSIVLAEVMSRRRMKVEHQLWITDFDRREAEKEDEEWGV